MRFTIGLRSCGSDRFRPRRQFMSVREIIGAHPAAPTLDRDLLVRCVEQCLECSASCTGCADASLAEDDVAEMRRCIRLCLDCADVCAVTARAVGRQTDPDL